MISELWELHIDAVCVYMRFGFGVVYVSRALEGMYALSRAELAGPSAPGVEDMWENWDNFERSIVCALNVYIYNLNDLSLLKS